MTWGCQELGEVGNGDLFKGYRVPVMQNEEVIEMCCKTLY